MSTRTQPTPSEFQIATPDPVAEKFLHRREVLYTKESPPEGARTDHLAITAFKVAEWPCLLMELPPAGGDIEYTDYPANGDLPAYVHVRYRGMNVHLRDGLRPFEVGTVRAVLMMNCVEPTNRPLDGKRAVVHYNLVIDLFPVVGTPPTSGTLVIEKNMDKRPRFGPPVWAWNWCRVTVVTNQKSHQVRW